MVASCPSFFVNNKGDNRIKRFDKAWKTACKEAGIGERETDFIEAARKQEPYLNFKSWAQSGQTKKRG